MKETTSTLREPGPDSGGRASMSEGAGTEGEPAGIGARAYRVFLSYSHADTTWAHWLMRRLEGYRVPARFHGRGAPIGAVGPRIAPVFRDRDELPTTSDLGETIRAALRQSATLVVICSPAAARSRWVQEEILAFKRLGGGARVFAFIVAGEPKAEGTDDDCFSPALRRQLGADGQLSASPAEHVASDARPQGDGREDAFVRLVAGLLGVGFDELRQREQQRRHRRLTWITAGSVAGMAVTLGLAAIAWLARNEALVARNDAQRRQEHGEELIAGMLNDMKAGLQKADKLDALDEAGARMTAYFESLDPRDLTDNTLAQQAKALTQIGQIRIAQLRYADADAAFTAAFNRTAALVARHPSDGGMLFDRAQAEYWIGNMHLKRGNFDQTGKWFQRYRDSGVALAGLDPRNLHWQREAVSGHHNLAVLEFERGNLTAARDGFTRELAALKKLAAENPPDLQLEFSITNIVSFLGSVAERGGELTEARARFEEQTQLLEALSAKEPLNPRWQERTANALALHAKVLEITGRPDEALRLYIRVRTVLEALAAKDPANRVWALAWQRACVREADSLRLHGESAAAQTRLAGALAGLAKLEQTESSDRAVAQVLATAWRIEAKLRAANGRNDAAEAAAKARTIGEGLLAKGVANDDLTGGLIFAYVIAGEIARRQNDVEAAHRLWQRAVEIARPRIGTLNFWVVLDPAARALLLAGHNTEGRALVERLEKCGYRPLEPWPEATSPSSTVKTDP